MRERTDRELGELYGRARLICERHYAKPLTLALLARLLASSPRQLQRAYASFGTGSFREELTALRMHAARELLAQPAIPIGALARLVGYRQHSHFTKVFCRHHGIAPVAYRRALQTRFSGAPVMLRPDAPQACDRPAGPRSRRGGRSASPAGLAGLDRER
ncbi:MAG TPA: helix-turn-helix transcriptional regulator [Solirubrobacteraceae bacterium]|nr:helix-turn-helix transcriptional regulator [Solirubrobacteraceae bacterium]